jgi:3-oxoacyl-[acyl-carrier-protein] synthase-1
LKQRVYLGQHSIISPFGGTDATVESLLGGRSALQTETFFNKPVTIAQFPDLRYRELDFSVRSVTREIDLSNFDQDSMLFIYCAAKGDIRALEEPDSTQQKSLPSPLLSEQACLVTSLLGLQPARTLVVSNACASGAVAIEIAKEYLERDHFSCVVLFGFDCISRFVVSGFHSLSALSPDGARPFDSERNGLTLGEGTAMAVLHTCDSGICNGTLLGAGSSNDANHRTGPSRAGDGLYRAIRTALQDARPETPRIGAVKCHGTATLYNDAMEAKALYTLFGEQIPPFFSVKGALGHTSGSGSLLEFLLASRFLAQKRIPPTARFQTIGVDEPIPVSSQQQTIDGDSILCLSAGFGGLNSAIILKDTSR